MRTLLGTLDGGPPVSFGSLMRDFVVLCRQYFIPGEEDFLKLARQPVGKIFS